MSFNWIPSHPRVLELEDLVGDVFAIHDTSTRSGNKIVVLRGEFLRSPEMVYETLAPRFKDRGYIPVLRSEDGFDVVMAYPAPPGGSGSRLWLHALLFVATVLSTLWAGASQETGQFLGPTGFLANWHLGLAFSVPLLTILGVHEFGHYFVARAYGLDVSLPYFIPFPVSPLVGTLGAVIRIQSPFESRKALFDVGIAGPLAGLVVAIPVVAWGLLNAEMASFDPELAAVTVFNEPLLFQWMADLIVDERPEGMDLVMNPYLMAGWLGFLIIDLRQFPPYTDNSILIQVANVTILCVGEIQSICQRNNNQPVGDICFVNALNGLDLLTICRNALKR